MTTHAASSCSSQECPLASCYRVCHCIQSALANDSVIILHRSQWRCLAKTYSEVLQSLAHRCPLSGPSKIIALLRTLLLVMQDGERCIEDCSTARPPTFGCHSWLLDKALNLRVSTDVVNVHLHDFLCTSSAVFYQLTTDLPIDTVESDIVSLAKLLAQIWACHELDAKADVSEACYFLNAIKLVEAEGETSLLADFILQKLSHTQDLETVESDHVLPSSLWIDPGNLMWKREVQLGRGSYGKVYEARWLGGRFAVKDFYYVENNIAFGREAVIQARLRHPNVISLVCCTKKPSLAQCSLVMELMQHDLRVLLIKRVEAGMDPPFSLGVAVDLMLQIAQGMEYLHSLHIMHRDLKSSNVLVSFSKRECDADMDDVGLQCAHLKIADFGMSKAKHASSKYTTRPVGATPWRAPEVFEINPEDELEGGLNGTRYTKKADVYSFALVCYEILTGKCPFEGPHLRKRVLEGERPVLPSYCPRALSSYIERCWCAEASSRPPFSQICRMLRYFKACIFLQDQHEESSAQYHNWLLHPLSPDVCARIDDMVESFVQPMNTRLQPQPLKILLEMHCCRLVLKERYETIKQAGLESNKPSSSTDQGLQPNGDRRDKPSSEGLSPSCGEEIVRLTTDVECGNQIYLSLSVVLRKMEAQLRKALCVARRLKARVRV